MAETKRRREKQALYNQENGITPASVRSKIADILDSVYEKDSLTIDTRDPMGFKRDLGKGKGKASEPMIGHNFKTYLTDLEKKMREAASNLEFEEAARLRDELKRLQETELLLADDPLARQSVVAEKADEAVAASNKGRSSGGKAGSRGRRRRS